MITVNSISIHFSGNYLFDNVSFVVGDRDRIGLVGKNGAGKSTLLKIIAGQQECEKGNIVVSKYQTIGYLPQEMIPSSSMSVIDEALTAFKEVNRINEELEELNQQIISSTDYLSKEYENLLQRHSELTERLNVMGASNMQSQTEKVLLGLGFSHSDFSRKMNEFSSGWQMRVELAKILLQAPNTILLDEPTNHLDIESIQWLENFLANYYGAVILVSHDKAFLDNVCKRTIEINCAKVYDYKVSYSKYVELLLERQQQEISQLNNQQKQIAEIEKFIERFRYKATKSKQVQSRIKMLDKMERVEVTQTDTSNIHFKFPPAPHSGKIVVEMNNLNKSYGDKLVLKDVNLTIEKGEKVAFVGKNGEGKSTLSKIIVGKITDQSGEFKLGHQVKIGYFAQNQAALLDPNKTVFETIDDIAEGEIRTKIRTILGSFLFDEEAIEKKVKVLSGGEKTRLALAKLILAPVNLLILDEPTNHLDMVSKDILKMALMQYDGTLIVVSHDRDFLQGLTDTLYEFSHHHINIFKGDIFEFLESKKMNDLKDLNLSVEKKTIVSEQPISQNKIDYQNQKENQKEIRKIKNQITKIEEEIEAIEQEIAKAEEVLCNQGEVDADFYTKYENNKQLLNEKMQRWEELQTMLD
jgi:ATP-binding cassette subfamily F protein 3